MLAFNDKLRYYMGYFVFTPWLDPLNTYCHLPKKKNVYIICMYTYIYFLDYFLLVNMCSVIANNFQIK